MENQYQEFNEFKNKMQEMLKKTSKVDQNRLNAYIALLERFLIYNIAAQVLSQDTIKTIINQWIQSIKLSIDIDTQYLTEFFESTPEGKLAKITTLQDGEAFRLSCLKTLSVAKELAECLLAGKSDEDIFTG